MQASVEPTVAVDEPLGSCDFGRIVTGAVTDVVAPRSVEELVECVRRAARSGSKLTLRAGGNSQSGQAVCARSRCLDLRALDRVELDVTRRTARCQPGVTWRTLLQQTSGAGLVPYVVPLNLDLTVGGTLSVGGFGSTSHRHGAAVSNLEAVTLVDGQGDLQRCSAVEQREHFDATLAGLGRCGVIAEATLALRPARPRVSTAYLLYDDIGRLLTDQRALARRGQVDHMEGLCSATLHGLHVAAHGRRAPLVSWSYCLQLSHELEARESSPASLLEGLGHRSVVHTESDDFAAYYARYDLRFAAMRATGADRQPHPWLECVLPHAVAAEVVPRALALLPAFLGDMHRLTWIAAGDRPRSLVFPQADECVAFAVLPAAVHPALLGDARRALKAVEQLLLGAGGKRYLSGFLDGWDEQAFRSHFGDYYAAWRDAKVRFDPKAVFTSALFAESGCH